MRQRNSTWLATMALPFIATSFAHAAEVTVTATGDAAGACPGASCTLREAIATAAPGDTVVFSPAVVAAGSIELDGEALLVDKDLVILGPSAARLTVSAGAASRVLRVSAGEVVVSGLALREGRSFGTAGFGGAPGSDGVDAPPATGGCVLLESGAALGLVEVALDDCVAQAGSGGAGGDGIDSGDASTGGRGGNGGSGGDALGGGISSAGNLLLVSSSIRGAAVEPGSGGAGGDGGDSTTVGGAGGDGGDGGSGRGAAIHAGSGTLMLLNTTLLDSTATGAAGGSGGNGGLSTGIEGAGGNGGNGGVLRGGQVHLGPGADAFIDFSTLGPAAIATGAGGAGGPGGVDGVNGVASTVAGEVLDAGGSGTRRLRSAVLGSPGGHDDCAGTLQPEGANFAHDASCAGFSLQGSFGDQFAPLAFANGQPRLLPRPASMIVDAAPDCLDLAGAPVDSDQLGLPRPVDGDGSGGPACDLGAVEYRDALFRDGLEALP